MPRLTASRGMPAQFFGMIANIDENVGKLEDSCARNGLRENTHLIFMTDNGGTAGSSSTTPACAGARPCIYDGGHRVPCFVRWPAAKFSAPRDVPDAAQMQDLLPTFIDLCGLKKPANANFDGRSLAGVLQRPQEKIGDRMMVVQYGQIPVKWDACVIWNRWRLVRGEELFDLKADPAQKNDVAKASPDVLGKMRDHYEKWWDRVAPGITDFAPISLGSDHENPVRLTCSDWQDVYCDNPKNVSDAIGGPRGGPWNVIVEKDGDVRNRALALAGGAKTGADRGQGAAEDDCRGAASGQGDAHRRGENDDRGAGVDREG